MGLDALGYVGIRTKNLDDWAAYGTRFLGMQLVDKSRGTLALRMDDFEGNQLRIDEALKERQLGEDRIGDTKTDESDSYVPVLLDLRREIAEWIAVHPQRDNLRAFLFPTFAKLTGSDGP